MTDKLQPPSSAAGEGVLGGAVGAVGANVKRPGDTSAAPPPGKRLSSYIKLYVKYGFVFLQFVHSYLNRHKQEDFLGDYSFAKFSCLVFKYLV